jgi:hypothetical protein
MNTYLRATAMRVNTALSLSVPTDMIWPVCWRGQATMAPKHTMKRVNSPDKILALYGAQAVFRRVPIRAYHHGSASWLEHWR